MPTYHVFESPKKGVIADYILAGDGVYGVMDCFGARIPVPLVPCEIRGIPPLSPWLVGGNGALLEMSGSKEEGEDIPFAPSYHILTQESPVLPPVDPGRVYQYIIGKEGVFLLAGCRGLQIVMPISPQASLPGLASVSPYILPSYPLVSASLMNQILEGSRMAHDEAGRAIERLFYLLWDGEWQLHEPEQDAGREHVRARDITPEYLSAFIEGHSHHIFEARFSPGDDLAEIKNGGFRVYFVLGRIFQQPEIRVRICVHGYEWEVPAHHFFSLPAGIVDRVAQEWGGAA